ncbi:hypothetical protein L2755_20120, partial [Shewanella abyssi]|uniref:hypothetical protein n=1 Tax=Shewanella abyssi TaxID=311789 RepID=UPI00200F06E4
KGFLVKWSVVNCWIRIFPYPKRKKPPDFSGGLSKVVGHNSWIRTITLIVTNKKAPRFLEGLSSKVVGR